MKDVLTLLFLVLVWATGAAAQEKKPIVDVSHDRRLIELRSEPGQTLPARFVQTASELRHYGLTEIEPVDEPGVPIRDRTAWLSSDVAPECVGFNCPVLRIRLARELPAGQTFILAISDFTNAGGAITLRFTTAPPSVTPTTPEVAQITSGPDVYKQNSELQLLSKEDVQVSPTVEVGRIFYEISDDGLTAVKKSDVFVAEASKLGASNRRYLLKLDGKLVAGKEHVLVIERGITNSVGQTVRAEGKVKTAAIPTKPEELRIDTNWSAVAAVHQKAVLEMTAKYNPIRIKNVGGTEWLWEPVVNIDLGLRSTKSANSVSIAPLNFSNIFGENISFFQRGRHKSPAPKLTLAGSASGDEDQSKYIYADWLSTPWYRPANVKFTVGPKVEFDRNFKRKNVLGAVRFDLNFHRWQALISDKRGLIEDTFGKEIAADARLKYGFNVIPFLAFDFGGHVNNETVKKTVKGTELSVFVPRHKIFRSYLGVVTNFEINKFPMPITITIEEWLVHLAAREIIGFTNDDGAFHRNIRGFHHRGKATLALSFDPSKHYSITLTYENGRQAPNFEYLNKVTTGIKVLY